VEGHDGRRPGIGQEVARLTTRSDNRACNYPASIRSKHGLTSFDTFDSMIQIDNESLKHTMHVA
jgi:hypothetical protein